MSQLATVEELLEAVFSVRSVLRLIKESAFESAESGVGG
jgi:hypothetical protein